MHKMEAIYFYILKQKAVINTVITASNLSLKKIFFLLVPTAGHKIYYAV